MKRGRERRGGGIVVGLGDVFGLMWIGEGSVWDVCERSLSLMEIVRS